MSRPALACHALLALAAVGGAALPASAQEGDPTRLERRVVRIVTDEDGRVEEETLVLSGTGDRYLMQPALRSRAYLGFQLLELTPELRRHFGAPESGGAMVSRLAADGPAERAGVLVGDIVTALAGEPVRTSGEILLRLTGREAGEEVRLELYRDGERHELTVRLEERPRRELDLGLLLPPGEGGRVPGLEIELEDLPRQILQLDGRVLREALADAREVFGSPEWRERVRSMLEDRGALERRLRELEERLRELETELDRLPER